MSGTPDFVEPVVGFRAWRLADDGELVPWTVSSAGGWRPGVNTAVCHIARFAQAVGDAPRRTPRHRPPAATCMCGLYALHDARDPRIAPADGSALGAVVAWGDLEVHATGFRAEHACVVALALPDRTSDEQRARLHRAPARYGVPLVPSRHLEATAREHGAPLPAFDRLPVGRRGVGLGERPPWAFPAPELLPGGEVGFDFNAHVWLETATDHVVVGVTRELADLFGADAAAVRVTVEPPGTEVAAGDVVARVSAAGRTYLVCSPVAGTLLEGMEQPQRLLTAPEGSGWLVTLRPTAWTEDRDALRWGPEAADAYRRDAGRRQIGVDAFADVRAERVTALPRVTSWGDVLAQLRAARARPLPRFADTADLYDRLGVDLGCSLHDDPKVASRLGRMDITLALELQDPAARVTLELDGGACACGWEPPRPTRT